jgi:phosphoribosylglycinamide formyltransferase-1
MKTKRMVVFASGNGTNFHNIALYFVDKKHIQIALLIGNKSDAFVFERAKEWHIPSLLIDRESFYQTNKILNVLKEINPDLIVLSGFLWLIPENIIKAFSQKIINIHPALLPKYGGKGMYGMHVHRAVANNKEKETGISIHYVNKEYDKGDLILQAKCKLTPKDTPEIIAEKVHQLEYTYFPATIEKLLMSDE